MTIWYRLRWWINRNIEYINYGTGIITIVLIILAFMGVIGALHK